MSNQPLNPISYSQFIVWFAWNCRSKVKHFQNNFFHLKHFGVFDLYAFKKQFLSTLWSFDLNWDLVGLLKVLEVLQRNDPISLASRVTKLFGNSPLQQSEHSKYKNSEKNSSKFHTKVNNSANVKFSVYIINKIQTKKSSKIYWPNSYHDFFIKTKFLWKSLS